MNNISDYVSHAIQDELDSIIDVVYDDHIKMRLTKIRDSIPCSCGNEEEGEEEEWLLNFVKNVLHLGNIYQMIIWRNLFIVRYVVYNNESLEWNRS